MGTFVTVIPPAAPVPEDELLDFELADELPPAAPDPPEPPEPPAPPEPPSEPAIAFSWAFLAFESAVIDLEADAVIANAGLAEVVVVEVDEVVVVEAARVLVEVVPPTRPTRAST